MGRLLDAFNGLKTKEEKNAFLRDIAKVPSLRAEFEKENSTLEQEAPATEPTPTAKQEAQPQQSTFKKWKESVKSPPESTFQQDLPTKGMTKEETGKTALTLGSMALGGPLAKIGKAPLRIAADTALGAGEGALRAAMEGKDILEGAKEGAIASGALSALFETPAAVLDFAKKTGLSKRGKQLVNWVTKAQRGKTAIEAGSETAAPVVKEVAEILKQNRNTANEAFGEAISKETKTFKFVPPDEGLIAKDEVLKILKEHREREFFKGMTSKESMNHLKKVIEGGTELTADQLISVNKILNNAISKESGAARKGLQQIKDRLIDQSEIAKAANEAYKAGAKPLEALQELISKNLDEPEKVVKAIADAATEKELAKDSLLEGVKFLDDKFGTNLVDKVVGTSLKAEIANIPKDRIPDLRTFLALGGAGLATGSTALPLAGLVASEVSKTRPVKEFAIKEFGQKALRTLKVPLRAIGTEEMLDAQNSETTEEAISKLKKLGAGTPAGQTLRRFGGQ